MGQDFSGKVAVVTGGTRGIGRAIATGLAARGATTIVTYVSSDETARQLEGEAEGAGHTLKTYKVDSRDGKAIQEFGKTVSEEFGDPEVLVNNAGIVRDGLLFTMSDDDWDSVIDTNVKGAFHTVQTFARKMMRKRRGAIINLSSIIASRPGKGQANYAASKGAVESMTRALAAEFSSKKIRVNCVAPGVIETDMSREVRDMAGDKLLEAIPLGRYGVPEDIAKAVLFLASDDADYITGQTLHVDGGLY